MSKSNTSQSQLFSLLYIAHVGNIYLFFLSCIVFCKQLFAAFSFMHSM